MDNGFGVPQNQFLTSGAVSGTYLYASAVTYNLSTGMQLWRTANGTDWEKATPYDGLGNSNNRYAYRSAMAVFNGRLTLGITNWASGAGVWQKSLTADFTATPTRGAPPLTVQFTNTSAGDFTSSQWDFGDGATSTEANPTHTYTVPGTYAVTLTVGDGTDTSTITKPAYIVAKHFTYLPVVMRNYNPYLYDDFNDPVYEGSYNHALWVSTNPTTFQAQQRNGVLVITNGAISAEQGGGLQMQHPSLRTIGQIQQYEARLRLGSDHSGGYTVIEMYIGADNVNGHWWYTACSLGGAVNQQITIGCRVCVPGNCEYETSVSAAHDAWYKTRIEIDPKTTAVRFYVDEQLVGSHVPVDADALRSAQFRSDVHGWNGDANTYATRYVDDVRITPAQ